MQLTVTRHHEYMATRPILISRPKASLATLKLLLPFFRVSSAFLNPTRMLTSIGGGSRDTWARREMWNRGLEGGQGGEDCATRRRAWRWSIRDAESTMRYEVKRKKMNSLE